ncbi:MAG: helix-turn-helix transcriptional regulator [Candidatus Kapabacteria bacterium]|nr:helix-turn-helix transcriptional regulator [Candidatus Kapabacteria bacterium]
MEEPSVRKTKDFVPRNCPVGYCMNIIGGKWKLTILYMIRTNRNRHSLMLRSIPEISKQTLTNQLRELEADGIIERVIYPEIPPRVEYNITSYGSTLLPIIESMYRWSMEHMPAELRPANVQG